MTRNDAIEILGTDLAARAAEIGKAYGEQEADLYRDQNPGRDLPDWSDYQYAGNLSEFAIGTDTDSEENARRREAAETLIDAAAREEWEKASA